MKIDAGRPRTRFRDTVLNVPPRWPTLRGALASMLLGIVLILLAGRIPPSIFGAALAAGAAGVAWYFGGVAAVAVVGGVAAFWIARLSAHDAVSANTIVLTGAIAAAFAVWLAALRRLYDREHLRARRDELTGLLNRTAFLELCEAELSRAKRFARPWCMAMLDADKFKQVNDQRGHAAGDAALRETARVLSQTVRHYDVVARWGGDEFVLLFPEAGPEQGVRILERLAQALRESIEPAYPPLTFCIGMVTVFPDSDWDVSKCLAQADQELYAAKRQGRRTCRYQILGKMPPPGLPTADENP